MYKLSKFGTKLTQKTGILQLMEDLGKAMANNHGQIKMLGGGNPAHIPAMQEIFRKRMLEIAKDKSAFARMIGNYTTPQGDAEYLQAVANLLKKNYGWKVTAKNIAVVNSSQTAFFLLFNMLAGEMPQKNLKKAAEPEKKQILLPLVPEYIGYADQGISPDLFSANKPIIQIQDSHRFKYSIDFSTLKVKPETAAICISRPTNPTGNVVTDEEVARLHALAKACKIPLIIDNAYGAPFPNIIFTETQPVWDENIIHSLSLSKLGLPGTRTSILVAGEELISLISSVNAIVALAGNNIGPALTSAMIASGKIIGYSKKYITPFYREKSLQAQKYFAEYFPDDLPYYLHKSEGALFLWLWCRDLPISSNELYARLKKRNVLVISGSYFFPGLTEKDIEGKKWQHQDECLRLTYSQEESSVEEGIKIIAEEVTKAYN